MKLKVVFGIFSIVAALYLLQMASPLRLNGDAIIYLKSAESLSQGAGYLYQEHQPMYPIGFPAMLAFVHQLGLAQSWFYIAMNLLFLAIGILVVFRIANSFYGFNRDVALVVSLMTSLCFVYVKHVTLPLPDIPFFALSGVTIWILIQAERAPFYERIGRVSIALVLIVLALLLRTVGVALIPCWLWSVFGGRSGISGFVQYVKSRRWLVIGILPVVVLSGILFVYFTAQSRYWWQFTIRFSGDTFALSPVLKSLQFRLIEVGELLVNFPLSRLPILTSAFFLVVGSLAGIFLIRAFTHRWRDFHSGDVYLISYLSILLLWGSPDARFWIPLFPFILCWLFLGVRGLKSLLGFELLRKTYVLGFVLVGFASLIYSTRVSFSGEQFPEVYGDQAIRSVYRAAFYGDDFVKVISDQKGRVRKSLTNAYDLLKVYEPLASKKRLTQENLPHANATSS